MNWLSRIAFDFNVTYQVTESFTVVMNQQLKEDFRKKTGFKADNKKMVVQPENDLTIDKMNVAFLNTLIIIVYSGQNATLKWKSLKNNAPVLPDQEVTNDDVEFWWEFDDSEELLKTLKEFNTPIKLPFSVKAFRFKTKCYQLAGIDVIFKLQLSEPLADAAMIEILMDDIGQGWNDAEADRPPIHNWWLDKERSKTKEYVVFFDLGYASMDGIKYILEKLNESNLTLEKVIIDNA